MEVNVNTRALRNASEKLKYSSNKIDRTLQETSEIRHRLREMSNVDEFRWAIQRAERNIAEAESVISNMSSVLESICDRYDATENKINENGSVKKFRIHKYAELAHWLIGPRSFILLKKMPVIRELRPVLKYINRIG
jgi:DNA repair ATPase RecN